MSGMGSSTEFGVQFYKEPVAFTSHMSKICKEASIPVSTSQSKKADVM